MWFIYWRYGQQLLHVLEMGKKTYSFVKNQLYLTYWWSNGGLSKQRMYL